jgi:hypothetical protein
LAAAAAAEEVTGVPVKKKSKRGAKQLGAPLTVGAGSGRGGGDGGGGDGGGGGLVTTTVLELSSGATAPQERRSSNKGWAIYDGYCGSQGEESGTSGQAASRGRSSSREPDLKGIIFIFSSRACGGGDLAMDKPSYVHSKSSPPLPLTGGGDSVGGSGGDLGFMWTGGGGGSGSRHK